MDARELSFEQREGLAPLPTQLQRGEISRELRAKLWAYVHASILTQYQVLSHGAGQWAQILRDVHVERNHARIDKFHAPQAFNALGQLFESGKYEQVYGWLDYVMRHSHAPGDFGKKIGEILIEGRSAYRVVDRMIVPVASEEERQAFEKALADTANDKFAGARAHLRNAAINLTSAKFSDSIRESISAVESVARVLEPSGEFGKALTRLETKIAIHPALKKGFSSIYGYTSDEGGIRHALLDSGEAAVDETDAIFFLGACSSFVSYLIGKARMTGLA
ncbi:AbiJ-NTD4 domain-containing protein [Bradyrhizobium sp. CCBAU 21362]|uniref:AbiJ-NTD4 domain-containing protein n=1 Tax=Bradyrhizobium sp. CCBAU 21362 TaxID=1325082 RepID=UPI002304F7E8|nr:hypothetical protein [Bradyrhizobium sp. CCBAU 21362]